jgi:tetratricopeptide (TPR) repeat protein
MELTIHQALQKAVEAHKAGKLQDAESLYRAILQTQPKHPDANHNLGVLAVSLNKIEAALPLFKTALEANPNQGQFWLSYVDALIKEKQYDKAREVLEQGKKQGLAGDKVDELEAKLTASLLAQSSETSANKISTFTQQLKKISAKKEKKKNSSSNQKNLNKARNPSQVELNALLEHYQKGRYDLAENIATNLTKRYPKDPFGWKVLGVLFQKVGKLQDSLIAYQKVLEISPSDAETHYNLGITLKELGRLEEAKTSYKKAIAFKPDYAEAHSNLGSTLKGLGRLEDAEASYKKAIAIKPDYTEAHYNLGITLQDLGRLGEAETSYKKAIVINSEFAKAHYNLGITLQKLGRLQEAETSYQKAISIKPDCAEAHYKLGNILNEFGRLEDAETCFKNAILIKPDMAEAHSNLGNTLKQLGRLEDAETCFKNAISIKPDMAEAHNNLGNTLQELGREGDAETSFKKAIAIKPDLAEAHSNLGNTLKELGRLEDAETSYKKALAIEPDYAEAHSNLGITLQELGRLEEAETSYKKAISIKSEHANSYINLSFVLKELCRLEESEKSLSQIIKMKSNPISKEKASSVTALLPFGRSGSLFLHSLFDGHPEIATLPGIYLKGWFGVDSWHHLAPDMNRSDWRELLVARFVESHLPLFDAGNKHNVPGQPLGDAKWLSKSLGFMEMGNDRTQSFVVDKNAFSIEFLTSLKTFESIDTRRCFELIHRAFEIAIRGNEGTGNNPNGPIFYHIHNPNLFERSHFLQHYPHATMLHLMRNPVQSLESWLLQIDDSYSRFNYIDSEFKHTDQLKNWSSAVHRIISMFAKLRMPDHCLPGSLGVKIEDVKQNPRNTMPQLAARLGISNHPSLYESSFCGLQYWGPSSRAVGKITGFDTTAIDQPLGRLFGLKDVVIFETLFWPLSRLYGYTDLKVEGFRRQLMEIRPWLDEPLEFENKLYSSLPDKTCNLKDLPQYRRLHHLLHLFWNVLDRDGTYQDMVQPLKLD